MRWLFLLLLMLNAFYYIWHQQEAPLRPKEIMPLAMQRNPGQDIRLLSESRPGAGIQPEVRECLFLGGLAEEAQLRAVEQRLNSLDVQSSFMVQAAGASSVYWLKILPESRRLVSSELLVQLKEDFSHLKNEIMLCEGIASPI
jgi:hypothetical protein